VRVSSTLQHSGLLIDLGCRAAPMLWVFVTAGHITIVNAELSHRDGAPGQSASCQRILYPTGVYK